MSFLQGLTSGQKIAQGWLDTYEKSRKGKEAADLKTKREGILTAQPEYSQGITAEQGQQIADYGRTGAYDVVPQYGPATEGQAQGAFTGYQVAPKTGLDLQGDIPAAPMMYNQQRVANFLGGRVEGDLTPERMEGLRSRALANTLADPMDRQRALVQMDENERAARRAKQVDELTGLQISNARTTAQRENEAAAREQANRTAVLRVGEQLQAGGNIDIPTLYKFAGEAGADPAVLVKTAADFLNITEKSAEATTKKLLRDIDAASVSPTKFNTLLKNSFDPDPNDNLSPELRPAAGGGFQVFYGDKPMTQVFKDTKDMPALSQLASFYRDRLSGNPLATAVQVETLNAKRAQTLESEAGTKLKNAQAGAVGQEKLSPLEKNLATLRKLGISVTPEEVKGMVIKADKLSPEAAAQIELITASVKDNSTPANIAAARTAITDIFKGEGLKQRNAAIVRGLRTASERNDLPTALTQLQEAGVGSETIIGLARQAGVQLPANFAPAPASPTPAAQPTTGLTRGAQPAPYVPPADSRAGRALAARDAQIATAAETSRVQATAQAQLSSQFAADARTMSPVELIRKYDSVRAQLPTADKIQLQQAARNIR
jgi:hypothetical protein